MQVPCFQGAAPVHGVTSAGVHLRKLNHVLALPARMHASTWKVCLEKLPLPLPLPFSEAAGLVRLRLARRVSRAPTVRRT